MRDVPHRADGLILVGDMTAIGADDRQLRAALSHRHLNRIRRGAYVPADVFAASTRDSRYDLRIAAVVATRRSLPVLSHYSAARLWSFPVVNDWPFEVHLTIPRESGRRTKNGVIVHRHALLDADLAERGGLLITSRIRTLLDLARIAPFRDAVAALDHALHEGIVSREELLIEAQRLGADRGQARVERAITFASPLATLPGESYSRVLMHELGFPAPELQHEFVIPLAGCRYADFWWKGIRLIGEFDGKTKYFDPQFTRGKNPQEVFWQEKRRENELHDHETRLARWTWEDLDLVEPFVRRLEMAGLQRSRGRRVQ